MRSKFARNPVLPLVKLLYGWFFCGITWVVLASGCASQDANKQHAVRQRFDPAKGSAARDSSRDGASWTALVPLNDGTGVSRLMARAGIGERFPVKELDGRCLFEVLVVEGNDDRLFLQIHSVRRPQRIELVRDQPVRVQMGGSQFDLAYPSVTVGVARKARPISSQATLLIHRLP
jgi:hypothetical protein